MNACSACRPLRGIAVIKVQVLPPFYLLAPSVDSVRAQFCITIIDIEHYLVRTLPVPIAIVVMFRFFDFFLWLHCSLLGPYRWPHFLITPNNRLLAVRYQFCPFENCDAGEQVLKDIVRQYNRASFGKPGGNNLSRFTDDRTYILHLLRQELHFRFLEECELIIPIPTSTSLLPIEIVAKAILCV